MSDEIPILKLENSGDLDSQLKNAAMNEFLWLVSSVLSVLVVGYFSAFLPARVKLLGLFPVFLGMVVSGLILYWRNMWSYHNPRFLPPRFLPIVAFVLGVVCFGWSSYHSYQKFQMILNREMEFQKTLPYPDQKSDSSVTEEDKTDREVRESFNKMLSDIKKERQENSSFVSFLKFRVSALGNWHSWSAIVFWIFELVIAGVVSCLFTKRFLDKRIPITPAGE